MHYRAECLQNLYSVHSRRLQDRIQSSLSNITHLSLKYYFSLSQMQIFFPYHYNCKIHFKNAIHIEMSFSYCIIILLPVSLFEKPFDSSTIDRLESNMNIPDYIFSKSGSYQIGFWFRDRCLRPLIKVFGPGSKLFLVRMHWNQLIAPEKFLDWSTFERADHIRAKIQRVTL